MAYRKKKVEMLKSLEKKGIKKFFLQEKFEAHFDSEVNVLDTLYPGAVFESHGRNLLIKEKLSKVSVFFDLATGKIKTKNLMITIMTFTMRVVVMIVTKLVRRVQIPSNKFIQVFRHRARNTKNNLNTIFS